MAAELTAREKEIKTEILDELGSPVIKVEIDDTSWAHIFKASKRWFQARKGVVGSAAILASKEMQLPAEGELPYDVILPGGSGMSCALTAGFFPDIAPQDLLAGGTYVSAYTMTMSEYVLAVQSLQTTQRILGYDDGWTWEECRRLILLTGRVPSGMALVCFKRTIDSWTPDMLRDRDVDLFYRRVLIEAKRRLGRIRSKYSSYPAAGGEISMDGDRLLEEAKEEEEKLDEEIAASQMPIPMVRG